LFELIGLAFATFLLILLAAAAGSVFAAVAWLVVRNRECRRISLVLFAAAIPILSAAYFWLCIAFLPGESLFGDISQPLPNGYSLQALGKIPDFATINKGDSLSSGAVTLTECIGSLAVSGPIVAGRYSHPFGSFEAKSDEGYFLFDTRNGKSTEFRTFRELELNLGQPIRLVSTSLFRSSELSFKRQQRRNRIIMFGPIVAAVIGYIFWLLHFPRRNISQEHPASPSLSI
jgi:hypothetical protein